MVQQEHAYASTRTATFKLTSAASTPTSTPSGVVSGKLHGSLTPRQTLCQVLSRSTITTLRMETSISAWTKTSQASLSKTLTVMASLRPSTKLKQSIKERSKTCTRLWQTRWSAWGEPSQLLDRNSIGPTQEWWWTEIHFVQTTSREFKKLPKTNN